MKILIDMSSVQPQGVMAVNGGGEYAYTIFTEIYKRKKHNSIIEISLNSLRGNNNRVNIFCEENGICKYYYNSVEDLSALIKKKKYDLVILPVCYCEFCKLRVDRHIKLITVIHDLSSLYDNLINVRYGKFIKNDGLNWLRKIKRKILSKEQIKKSLEMHNQLFRISDNQIIITDSYYSKHSFFHYLDIPIRSKDNIKVLYVPEKNGMLNKKISQDEILKIISGMGIKPSKFFLLSSACRWAKNNTIAIFVLDKMFSDKRYKRNLDGFKVVVLGTDVLYKQYYLRKIKNKDNFIFLDYISGNMLQVLYTSMHIFIYPSLLEGFGLPPVEAMKYGKVTACSTAMSIPEVCGNASIYFDPYNKESIEIAISKSFDLQYMNVMRENVKNRYEELSNIRKYDLEKFLSLINNL